MHSRTAHIAEPAGVDRRRWPITAGVPFAQGEIRSGDQIRLECDGKPSQCHWDVRARWPDGSVRWTLLDTQVDVAASSRTECVIHYGADVSPAPITEPSPLQATETENTIDVDTGVARISIGRSGYRIFTAFSTGGQALLRDQPEPQLIATTRSCASPLHAEIEDANIEECNSMRVVVCLRGHYVNQGNGLLGWTLRIHLFLNHSHVRVYHTIVHDHPTHPTITLNSLRLSLPLQLAEPRTALVGSLASMENPCGARRGRNPPARELTAPIGLLQTQLQHHQVSGMVPEGQGVQVREGNCFGWIHLSDQRIGVTVKLIRPWQNGPMALSTDGSNLDLHLYPDLDQPGLTAMGSTPVSGAKLPQGIAKTHELAIHVGPPCTQFLAADRIAIGLEHPLLLSLPGEHWAETGVFGSFQIVAEDCWPLEAKLRTWSRVPSDLGFLEFGGCADPNEQRFGLARSLLLQYLRSHEQSLFWRARALLFHEMDAGTCHFHTDHPEWTGGPYRPDRIASSAPSAQFARVDGLIDFYFLTGYRRAYEVAESCTDFCRRNAPYDWREELDDSADFGTISGFGALATVGNALNAMGTFFAAFPEERFLRSMEALVDLLEAWQDTDGRWSHPIGFHRNGAEPALTASVLEGLSQYHAASGDERARRMATDGALYLVHHGRTAEGLFFQQQSLSDLRPCARSLALLPALSETFEHTGDSELLDAGLRIFRWAIHHDFVTAAHLKDLIAFMPLLENLKLLEEFRVPVSSVNRMREHWPHSVVSGDQ